jgi:peptidyl-dipeptidase A
MAVRPLRLSLSLTLAVAGLVACKPAAVGPQQPAICPPAPASSWPATAASEAPPTVDEARAFYAKVDADLRKLFVTRDTAAFARQTNINDDTEKLSADMEEATMEYLSRTIKVATRYDGLDLPPDLARQRLLLKLTGSVPAPSDPKERAELATILASMDSMYGKGKYCPPGKPCKDLGELSKIIKESRKYDELKEAWVGWHSIAPPIKDKFTRYAELSNKGSREIGFKDLGALWRSGYDMPAEAFEQDIERLWSQVKPLYDDLHCYTRSKLRKTYGKDKIGDKAPIPAHLLGNMWAQEWSEIYPLVEPYAGQGSLDVSANLKKQKYDEVRMVKLGEKFFTSLGMDPLPKSFWERSMFKKPRDREVVCHASAWDPGYSDDLRIKMCIKPDEENLITIHHELGHDYYFHYYYTLPMLFQQGANDGFHEGIGDTLALSVTPRYLKEAGLLDKVVENQKAEINQQLKMALEKVAFLPFGLVIDKWRWDVFSGKTPKDKYNAAWWELRQKYQGIEAPVARSEADFDPGAKYHIPGNTPYIRYFLARIYQFQFHKALCKAAGQTGPLHTCSIYGNKAAGDKLTAMLKLGASRPWPEAMAAISGDSAADAAAMLEYFAPLATWLKEQNKGEQCGWDDGGGASVSAPATVTASAPATGSAPAAGCPDGATEQGAAPPKGRELYCAKKDAAGTLVKHGRYASYTGTGKPELEGEYRDGKESGHWVLYDVNGKKESEGDFVEGRKQGVWITYDATGKKTSEKTFKDGSEVKK